MLAQHAKTLCDVVVRCLHTPRSATVPGELQAGHSTVRHEPPSGWIFKSKGVLESQDADIKMVLRGGRTKRSSLGESRASTLEGM